jgi:hypothetical protein
VENDVGDNTVSYGNGFRADELRNVCLLTQIRWSSVDLNLN